MPFFIKIWLCLSIMLVPAGVWASEDSDPFLFGDDIPLDEVVTDFSKTHKIPIMKRIKNQIKRIVLRRAINIYNSENSEP